MTELKELLELRTKIKEKKPDFIRQDYQRRKRLGRKLKWRKPKGIHSKIRHHLKGRRTMPSPGYKSPYKVHGLHATGSRIVHVHSLSDLDKIVKDSEGIVIAKQVGFKKKSDILKKARELGIEVLNFNIDEQIKKIEDFVNSKKKEQKEAKKEVKAKKETIEKEQKLTGEHKKEAEKKEKDKILTKKV